MFIISYSDLFLWTVKWLGKWYNEWWRIRNPWINPRSERISPQYHYPRIIRWWQDHPKWDKDGWILSLLVLYVFFFSNGMHMPKPFASIHAASLFHQCQQKYQGKSPHQHQNRFQMRKSDVNLYVDWKVTPPWKGIQLCNSNLWSLMVWWIHPTIHYEVTQGKIICLLYIFFFLYTRCVFIDQASPS